MKRYAYVATVLACLAAAPMPGQDTPTALAEKQEIETRFKDITAKLENLDETIQAYQKRLDRLTKEIEAVRDEIAQLKSNNSLNTATQKSLETLAEKVKEVDNKRIADNEKVMTALEKLGKSFSDRTTSPVRSPGPASPTPSTTASHRGDKEKGWEYTVVSGDNPAVIASKLRKQGINISANQIMSANPGVNWYKLKIGQKIFVPEPPAP